MSTTGMLARIDSAEAALRRLQTALGYVRGSLDRSEKAGESGAVYAAAAEREMVEARRIAYEAFAVVDLATATPEPGA